MDEDLATTTKEVSNKETVIKMLEDRLDEELRKLRTAEEELDDFRRTHREKEAQLGRMLRRLSLVKDTVDTA